MDDSTDAIAHPAPDDVASMPLFAGLQPAEHRMLASWFVVEERDAGTPLTREGTPGYAFFVLKDGTATVRQGDDEIRQLGAGDFFGELAIIGLSERTATVTATSAVVLWTMFGTKFRTLETQFPELAEKIRTTYGQSEGEPA